MNMCLAALSTLIHLMHPGQRRRERNMYPAVAHISKGAWLLHWSRTADYMEFLLRSPLSCVIRLPALVSLDIFQKDKCICMINFLLCLLLSISATHLQQSYIEHLTNMFVVLTLDAKSESMVFRFIFTFLFQFLKKFTCPPSNKFSVFVWHLVHLQKDAHSSRMCRWFSEWWLW